MSLKPKTVMIIQALLAFIGVFTLNYFVLGISLFLSFTGAAGYALLLWAWSGNRYYELTAPEARARAVRIQSEKGDFRFSPVF